MMRISVPWRICLRASLVLHQIVWIPLYWPLKEKVSALRLWLEDGIRAFLLSTGVFGELNLITLLPLFCDPNDRLKFYQKNENDGPSITFIWEFNFVKIGKILHHCSNIKLSILLTWLNQWGKLKPTYALQHIITASLSHITTHDISHLSSRCSGMSSVCEFFTTSTHWTACLLNYLDLHCSFYLILQLII